MPKLSETELRELNPWKEVADKYIDNSFLLSDKKNLVCTNDKDIINEFNNNVKPEYQYHLNIPAYPWYGNPLTAKVIVLSLNPSYVEHESKIASLYKLLPSSIINGYTEHLRSMLTFNCHGFLPQLVKGIEITPRDLANIHQSYYWYNRLTHAFINKNTELNFEDVNDRFAVIQYVGYSSQAYKPFKRNQILPSQKFTKQLIQYILDNNPETLFIVPRAEKKWRDFLNTMWDSNRFFVSNLPISQRFSAMTLGDSAYASIVNAFKKPI